MRGVEGTVDTNGRCSHSVQNPMTTDRVLSNAELDVPERIHTTLTRLVSRRVADALATEAAVFYYAFASWGRGPFVPVGSTAYPGHRKSGQISILYTLAALAVIEILIVDLVLRAKHHVIADLLLAVSVVSVVWVIGFARSIALRPTFVDDATLALRMGVRWSIDIPRSNIAAVELSRARSSRDNTTPGSLRLVTQPTVRITLREPQIVRRGYGASLRVQHIAFAVDDVKKFTAQFND